ncbi:2-ketoarginine methyltransferase [Krasilnikovia cinnamomea]|uniref:2-ketoarginine methyltransferase n=1 Tax=Krasilnikovia cinnamomea TaxID=349313 RepID=A0A4Q7ZL31_9ACTN|nr:methyltransferase domain-containing protein [Krasilnikovia cinnamomea]RZU51660.1 2-ketoarginine methyltransferase [Krasilnikovia cinnamomea]
MAIQEQRLVKALEPFKGFVLSTMIFTLQQSGLQEAIARGTTVDALVTERGLDRPRLVAMVDYFVAAGLVARSADGVLTLTEAAREYDEARAWYEMMIGGYGTTFLSLGDHLAKDTAPAPRNGGLVGSGSCGMSLHDSIPLLRGLLATTGRDYRRLVDLGCGSGVYLTELCRDYPQLTAVGIEPDELGAQTARTWVDEHGLADRISIAQTGALDWIRAVPDGERPDLAVLAFVIHEVLGQDGEEGVRELLNTLFDTSPDLDLAIVDIDLRSADAESMSHPLAQHYYNAYFLMHPFTSQRLESRGWWEKFFADCGLEIVASALTDPAMDSTGFELGWIVRRVAA